MIARDWVRGMGLHAGWQEGVFCGDGNVLCLGYTGGYRTAHLCLNSLNCVLKMTQLYCVLILTQ